jgi:DNA-binding protein HU-beta
MQKRPASPSKKALLFQEGFALATAEAADKARRAGIEPVGVRPKAAERQVGVVHRAQGVAVAGGGVRIRHAAKQNTVSLKHLAAALAETHEMPKKNAEALLNDLITMLAKHLKKGDRIRLAGLGVVVVRKRAARMGRNPATGEPVQIKASKKVAFRAAKDLKESI